MLVVARTAEAYYAYGPIRELSPATRALEGHPVLSALAHALLLSAALVVGGIVVAALVRPPHDP